MDQAKALRDEGASLFVDGKFSDALPKFRQSLDIMASLPTQLEGRSALQLSCWLNISSCCVKEKAFDAAIDAATQALSIDKKSSKALFRRGQAYVGLNMITKARVDLRLAWEMSNGDPAIEAELSRLRLESSRAAPDAPVHPIARDFAPGRFGSGEPASVRDEDDESLDAYLRGAEEQNFGLGNSPALGNVYQQMQELKSLAGGGGGRGSGLSIEDLATMLRGKLGAPGGGGGGPFSSSSDLVGPVEVPPQLSALHDLAVAGDAEAMLALGEHFENGTNGARKHPTESFRWYLKASESGLPKGHSYAAWCYRNGFGTPKDLTKAVSLYRAAAEAGVTKAQACLGFLFEKGEGVGVDLVEAAKYYAEAAEAGDATSQVNLGLLYERGQGVPKQDYAEALRWFTAAAEQGNLSACVNVGLAYEKGQGTAKDMTAAFYWYQKAANAGDHTAQAIVGCCYEKGLGVAANRETAQMWYVRSAEQGNGHAREGLKRLMGIG